MNKSSYNIILNEFEFVFLILKNLFNSNNRRSFGGEREVQEHQRRIGPDPQRIARLLNNYKNHNHHHIGGELKKFLPHLIISINLKIKIFINS